MGKKTNKGKGKSHAQSGNKQIHSSNKSGGEHDHLPFVSICTPTFNRRPFWPMAIKCFEEYTYPKERMEWIIVDDGSTDGTTNILKKEFENLKIINKIIKAKNINFWVNGLTKVNVPCGPINDISQVFEDPQVKSRNMKIKMKHRKSKEKIDLIASPIKFSVSKIKYKKCSPERIRVNACNRDSNIFI